MLAHSDNAPARRTDHHNEEISARIRAVLSDHGLSGPAIAALIAMDAEIFHWRRRLQKREFVRQALKALDLGLEQTQFEVILVTARLGRKDKANSGEPQSQTAQCAEPHRATIGAIATALDIDPSRASRLVADLVNRGYVRRLAAQEDGRKSCIALTKAGQMALSAVMDYKWRHMANLFADWDETEIETFSRLLARYNKDRASPPSAPDAKARSEADAVRAALAEELAERN